MNYDNMTISLNDGNDQDKIDQILLELSNLKTSVKNRRYPNPKKPNILNQRYNIALMIVFFYFILIFIVLLATIGYNIALYNILKNNEYKDQIWSIKDNLLLIGTLIGNPLSVIIGFYFHKEKIESRVGN
jgi:hypothetical protein